MFSFIFLFTFILLQRRLSGNISIEFIFEHIMNKFYFQLFITRRSTFGSLKKSILRISDNINVDKLQILWTLQRDTQSPNVPNFDVISK